MLATAGSAQPPYLETPVSDPTLAEVRGTFSPSGFALTLAQLQQIQDNAARDDFRFMASANNVVMDTWWATSGADLIAASVAAQQP